MDEIRNGDIVWYVATHLQASSCPSIDIFQLKVVSIEYNLMQLMVDDRVIDARPVVVNNQLFRTRCDAMKHGISELRAKAQAAIDWTNKYEQRNLGAIQ